MLTIKWKVDTLLECIDEDENDWMEEIFKDDEFDVLDVKTVVEDKEEGDMVSIYMEDGVIATTNSNWFEILD